jgi:predicted dithiol-disulfide oxidoreductase (DUF899 family)
MTDRKVGTREEWLAARVELLEREKELTRRSDELARERAALPWVRVEQPYTFASADGPRTLADLFGGRSQLLVYHLMMGPDWSEPCVGCAYTADGFAGTVVHLENRDVAFVAVSRAPVDALEAYKRRAGWTFPWVSALDSDFNLDFSVFTDEERRAGRGFNFGTPAMAGYDTRKEELHGLSAFALDDGVVYHTYSCYDRGTDGLNATWQLLDRTPNGRFDGYPGWPRLHHEYASAG